MRFLRRLLITLFSLATVLSLLAVGVLASMRVIELPFGLGPEPVAIDVLNPESVPAGYAELLNEAAAQCDDLTAPVLAAQLETVWNTSWPETAEAGRETIEDLAARDCAMAEQMGALVEEGKIVGVTRQLMLAGVARGAQDLIEEGGFGYDQTPDAVTQMLQRSIQYSQLPPTSDTRAAIVAAATSQRGVIYSWGGGSLTGPSFGVDRGQETVGFDCSGLVRYAVYSGSKGRIELPRHSSHQIAALPQISQEQAQPGDLVGFAPRQGAEINHVAIYLGDNLVLEAPYDNIPVKITDLGRWMGRPITFVNVEG